MTANATLLQQTLTALLDDAELTAILKERGLSLLFVQRDPETVALLSGDGVTFDEFPQDGATLRFELSGDTLHKLLTGQLSLPRAAAARLLTVKGPVTRLRQLGDVLPRVGAAYAAVARQAA
ncbi:hypothetical protein GCM10009759_63400 [Kitasatospora saccharophila]|uniref:SCP-2 sterol transfer family protein n=1 Tax=Kitasatospora saccharophila TaxID=407973 RepID=A0ABP5JLD0_9ACTN